MKTKEKQLGYVDLLNQELKESGLSGTIHTKKGTEISVSRFKWEAEESLKAAYELFPKSKGKIYEVILREVEE